MTLYIAVAATAQQGVAFHTEAAEDSYILYCDRFMTYLVDNCGGIVNTWPVGEIDSHLHPKLLDDGTLIRIARMSNLDYRIQEYNWEGELVKEVRENRGDIILHYEVIKLENGNYLTAGRNIVTEAELVELGYTIPQADGYDYMDMMLELDPDGNIVWEWNIKDHMIQQRDSSSTNYGIVADHPELLDMEVQLESFDWGFRETFMINSFDYNAELDQIIISIRKMGEIAIIDHSTTTEEAAGHTGGRYGKGGDILWRWGNAANYGVPDATRFLYYQHNPNWIDRGPYKGLITCFNNGLNRPGSFNDRYSQVPVLNPNANPDGSYELVNGEYGADALVDLYGKYATNSEFYSSYTSGAEFLDNGNIHITIGQEGKMLELDSTGQLVWEYYILNDGYIYRSERLPKDHPAFDGRDMTVTDQVLSTYDCLNTATITIDDNTAVDYEVTEAGILLQTDHEIRYTLHDMQGKLLRSGEVHGTAFVDTANYPYGIYVLTFVSQNLKVNTVKIIK